MSEDSLEMSFRIISGGNTWAQSLISCLADDAGSVGGSIARCLISINNMTEHIIEAIHSDYIGIAAEFIVASEKATFGEGGWLHFSDDASIQEEEYGLRIRLAKELLSLAKMYVAACVPISDEGGAA